MSFVAKIKNFTDAVGSSRLWQRLLLWQRLFGQEQDTFQISARRANELAADAGEHALAEHTAVCCDGGMMSTNHSDMVSLLVDLFHLGDRLGISMSKAWIEASEIYFGEIRDAGQRVQRRPGDLDQVPLMPEEVA